VFDAEFNIWREGDGGAIKLIYTKMKDGEESKQAAFNLLLVELFTNRDGVLISSLEMHHLPCEAREPDPELADIKHLSGNNAVLWQSIRSRKAKREPCNVSVIRDDITALFGENGRKWFKIWLDKLVRKNIIIYL